LAVSPEPSRKSQVSGEATFPSREATACNSLGCKSQKFMTHYEPVVAAATDRIGGRWLRRQWLFARPVPGICIPGYHMPCLRHWKSQSVNPTATDPRPKTRL